MNSTYPNMRYDPNIMIYLGIGCAVLILANIILSIIKRIKRKKEVKES